MHMIKSARYSGDLRCITLLCISMYFRDIIISDVFHIDTIEENFSLYRVRITSLYFSLSISFMYFIIISMYFIMKLSVLTISLNN